MNGRRFCTSTVLGLYGTFAGHCLDAKEIPVADFFATQDVSDVTVSPDGRYIAARGDTAVQILDFDTLAPVGRVYRDARYTVVDDYWWVNDDRIVLTTRLNVQRSDRAWPTSTFIASNVDGKRQSSPYQLFRDGETRIGITIVDVLRGDERNVLVERGQQPFPPYPGRVNPQLMLLDVYSRGDKARLRKRQSSPLSFGNLYPDLAGQARVGVGLEGSSPVMLYRPQGERKWQNINESVGNDPSATIRPVGFMEDGQRFHMLSNHASDKMALYRFEPEPPRFELVREHPDFDIADVDWDATRTRIVGLRLEGVSPKYLVVDKESAKVAALRRYGRAFPGEWMQVASVADDGNRMVLNVFSDRNPGVWYLLDVKANQIRALMPQRPAVTPSEMVGSTALTIETSDGESLHAYLTRDAEAEGGSPLIVLPHEGPHGVRDNWAFDPVVQLFANRGFAVLRVNYRGSAGFGRDFERAGYRQWGGAIIDDIVAATRSVVARDEIDGGRVCILGTHYGAFASLAAVARAPELFRCAAGHAGVYDLALLWGRDGVPMHMGDEPSLSRWIGRNRTEHRAQSPVHQADRIKVPVLLSHGGFDDRAPLRHTEMMRDAIKTAGGTVETFIESGKTVKTGDAPDFIRGLLANADAFHAVEDKVRLYERILDFVVEHAETE